MIQELYGLILADSFVGDVLSEIAKTILVLTVYHTETLFLNLSEQLTVRRGLIKGCQERVRVDSMWWLISCEPNSS